MSDLPPSSPGPVVITGGASGIGLAVAERLVTEGREIVIADLDGSAAEAAANRLGRQASAHAVDVTDSSAVDAVMLAAGGGSGSLAGLVNCAGAAQPTPSKALPDESWNRLVDIHLGGTMRACRAAYPFLRAVRGAIVNVSSVGAHVGSPQRLAYNSAKAGVEGLTRTLAVEWAPRGVRVNAVAPGYVRTAMWEGLVASGAVDGGLIEARIPARRFAEPSEIAAVITFLLSADASYLTGQAVVVDGGMTVDGDWYAPAPEAL